MSSPTPPIAPKPEPLRLPTTMKACCCCSLSLYLSLQLGKGTTSNQCEAAPCAMHCGGWSFNKSLTIPLIAGLL